MAARFFAGVEGRLKLALIAPNLALDIPVLSASTVTIAGITDWKVTLTAEQAGIVHFESPATATGVLGTEQIQGGIETWTAEITGFYYADPSSPSAYVFTLGSFAKIDFIIGKNNSDFGYKGAYAKIMNYSPASGVNGGPDKFTMSVSGHGLFPETPS